MVVERWEGKDEVVGVKVGGYYMMCRNERMMGYVNR